MSQVTSLANSEEVPRRTASKRMPSFLFPDPQESQTAGHILKQSVISNFEHSQYSIMCRAPAFQLIFFQALAIFIFVFGCSSMNDPQQFQIHALYAVFLLFAICISGNLTGANINPSITLSNYLRKQNKYTLNMIPIYIAGQMIGVMVALILARYNHDVSFVPVVPENQQWTTLLRQFANQMMGTILMVFFILQITNPNTTFIQNQISGFLSIVLFFYLAIVLSPNTSSFAINFVIIVGVNLCASIFQGNHSGWQWIWIYLLGEICGVLIATFFYDKIFQPIIKNLRQVRRQSLTFSTDFTEVDDD